MTINKIAIIKYGLANIASVKNAINNIGIEYEIVENPKDLYKYKNLILPGVGNFSKAMSIINSNGWKENILEAVHTYKRPILGICLGMQLLASWGHELELKSDNDRVKGLGLIEGEVRKLDFLGCLERIPHVGWNGLVDLQSHDIFEGIEENTDFYFVHSYAFIPKNKKHLLAIAEYSSKIPAVVAKDKIWGVQFHPEKSSKAGSQIIKNFFNLKVC